MRGVNQPEGATVFVWPMRVHYNDHSFILTQNSDQIQRLAFRPDHPKQLCAEIRAKNLHQFKLSLRLPAIGLPILWRVIVRLPKFIQIFSNHY